RQPRPAPRSAPAAAQERDPPAHGQARRARLHARPAAPLLEERAREGGARARARQAPPRQARGGPAPRERPRARARHAAAESARQLLTPLPVLRSRAAQAAPLLGRSVGIGGSVSVEHAQRIPAGLRSALQLPFASLPTRIVVAVFSAALVTGIAVTAISICSTHRFPRAKS